MGVGFPVRVIAKSSATDCTAGEMLTAIDDVFAEITGLATPVAGVEIVQVRESLGRVLATNVAARAVLPRFDHAAMDAACPSRSGDGAPRDGCRAL
jgi:molybdopterin biosynthesis enzyme